jgi:hypothetical protein
MDSHVIGWRRSRRAGAPDGSPFEDYGLVLAPPSVIEPSWGRAPRAALVEEGAGRIGWVTEAVGSGWEGLTANECGCLHLVVWPDLAIVNAHFGVAGGVVKLARVGTNEQGAVELTYLWTGGPLGLRLSLRMVSRRYGGGHLGLGELGKRVFPDTVRGTIRGHEGSLLPAVIGTGDGVGLRAAEAGVRIGALRSLWRAGSARLAEDEAAYGNLRCETGGSGVRPLLDDAYPAALAARADLQEGVDKMAKAKKDREGRAGRSGRGRAGTGGRPAGGGRGSGGGAGGGGRGGGSGLRSARNTGGGSVVGRGGQGLRGRGLRVKASDPRGEGH